MKKENILRWEFEIIRSRSSRSRSRRKHKYWAQFTLGIILGLVLGLVMESNLFETKGIRANDTFCKFSMEKNLLSVSKINSLSHFNENPLKAINLSEFDGSPHNIQESLVFVGVMTAQKYLSTRAVAVYETWGRELTGRIGFFSSESSAVPENCKDLPLIRLRKVDDSYPPQKKSFMMLQYMWENYGNRFEWFVRADDDVYIRPDKLENFLRSVDSKKPFFIGQAGRGNQEEFGLLSLEYDENFCMGGPGIIISRETLSRIAPHIKYCLKNLYTTHEDVELGRCVRKFADISCTWSYEMQTILYHNSSGYEAFTGNLKQKEVNRAITLHPVKQYQYMYRLHNYMRHLKIQHLQHEIIMLLRDIKEVLDLIGYGEIQTNEKNEIHYQLEYKKYLRQLDIIGQEPSIQKFQAKSEEELLSWDFIQRSMYSKGNLNPRRRIEAPFKEGLEDVIREFMEMINQFSRQRGRVIEYQDLLYGYSRLDPLHGADYILDMLLKYKKYRGRKMTVPVRRHAYLQQQFTGIEIRDITNKEYYNEESESSSQTKGNDLKHLIKESLVKLKQEFSPLALSFLVEPGNRKKIINFILPLSGRYGTFLRFMENYEQICLNNDDYTALVVVLFRNTKEKNSEKIVEHFEKFKKKYPRAALRLIPVDDEFARAVALEIGAAACSDDDNNILFFIDVDIVFGTDTLERIRRNTIRERQVYFPIVYSEFDPTLVYGNRNISSSPNHFLINSNTGYWRQFGFGVASIFKKDLRNVGGLNTSIRGWGKEDVDLFEKFISSGNVTIFRTIDPTLIHVFHIVDCDPNLETTQLKMCKGTRKDTYGNVNQLADCIYREHMNFTLAIKKKKSSTDI